MTNKNIVNGNIVDYIRQTAHLEKGMLGELQKSAYLEGLPIIPIETVSFIKTLLTIIKPKKTLEIGCAVGFSACLVAGFLPPDGHVTTIDRYPYMIERARENFKKLSMEDKITLIEGDASDILPMLNGFFDMIFLDAAKGQYLRFLPECIRLLKTGGVLLCDDVLQNGIENHDSLSVPKRARSTHRRMRKFLQVISDTEGLETSILTIGGGLSITVKNQEKIVFDDNIKE